MREIVSPLSGIRSPFGGRSDLYKEAGFRPEFVADFGGEYYRANLARSTFPNTLTFSRASNATMVDSTGTLVTVGVDEHRIGHHIWDGSAWVDAGYLHESEARTNLVLYSDLSSGFSNTEITRTGNQAEGPDGENSLSIYTVTTATSPHEAYTASYGVVSDAVYTHSIVVKKGTLSYFGLRHYRSQNNWASAVFDLDTMTVSSTGVGATSGTVLSAEIEDLGNSLYRLSLSASATGAGAVFAFQAHSSASPTFNTFGGESFAGASKTFYAGFAQLEAGSTPSSYIPTSGSTATRAAETLTASSANLPWPTPQVIGDELVTNGTFDTDSDWAYTTGWSITGGKLEGVATGGVVEGNTQQLATISGKVYLLTLDVDAVDGNDVIINVGSSLGSNTLATAGSKSYLFVAAANDETFQIRFSGASTAGDTITIDNISVKEINPLALSIQMEGTMTGDTYTPIRWYLDANNAILQDIGSSDFTFTQEAAGVVDTVTGGSFTSGINVPFNIASRHGSNFINGAVDGTALTENSTPVALPDLSSTDLEIGYDFMGTIKTLRIWADDIGDTGIEAAST